VNEPHAFLAADDAIAAGCLCFIEPPIGNVEECFVVSTVARTIGNADTNREPAFRPAPVKNANAGGMGYSTHPPASALVNETRLVDCKTIEQSGPAGADQISL
jgi:hypothetical protein